MDGHYLNSAYYVLNSAIVKFVNDVFLLKYCTKIWNT